MPSNRIIVASAGSGKTSRIIEEVAGAPDVRCAAITYTMNNRSEIAAKALASLGHIPPNLKIDTWYAFLMRHFVRPYQHSLHNKRVTRLKFVNGGSARGIAANRIAQHYFDRHGQIYIDKVSKFACAVIEKTGGAPLARFQRVFGKLYIDECQDLAGYDLNLVEALMVSDVEVVLVGDHRQATFSTNNAGKNKAFRRAAIIDKFTEWEKAGYCSIEFQNVSHRSVQSICDFADQLNPDLPATKSLNENVTQHDGIFAIRVSDIDEYMARFAPQTLRYNRTQKGIPGKPINYGEAKGMTFERTLIFPHGPLLKYLKTGNLADAGKEIPKIYVAVTRARQSSAFVVPDDFQADRLPFWNAQV